MLLIGAAVAALCVGCDGRQEDDRQRQAAEENAKQVETALRTYDQAFPHVISGETEYYTGGPQQGRPADGRFSAGTKVRVLEKTGSYVRVRSEDGVEAYVAADAVARPEGIAGDVLGVAEANNRFALDLYRQLRAEEGNLFFSPSSISTALAMAYAGAAGETEAEMAKTLHFQMPEKRLHEGMQSLQALWKSPAEENDIRLHQANRLWGQRSYDFLPAFLEITREHYGAELAEVDFAQSEEARRRINAWVEEQTERKITELVPAGALSSNTRLVLTNAVYFHGVWAAPFNEERTTDEDFHVTAAEKVQVPLMHRQDEFRYAAVDDLQILELPYGERSLSMLVLLPREVAGLAKLEAELTFQNLQRWLASVKHEDEVKVYLPRFKTTSQFQLSDTLAAMGMQSAFDRDAADFSGMTDSEDLFISAVIHKAFVDVNEEGTEAAAATGAVIAATAAPVEPEEPPVFRADHPFVFLIRDNRNDSILFLGRIENPLK